MRVNIISESEFTVQWHGVHTAFLELVKALEKQENITVQKNSDDPADILHFHTVGFYAVWKLLFSRGKKVITAHIVPESFIGSIKGAEHWKWLATIWLKFFYSRADLLLACSASVQRTLNNMGIPNVEVFYNTIDMSEYRISREEKMKTREKFHIPEGTFVVLGNGQIQPRKRFDLFVKLAHDLPEMQFFWVGGIPFKNLGAEYGVMQDLLSHLPSNLTVTGIIPLSEVRQYYALSDAFCLLSTQENHPIAVLEAAWSDLPILLRDIPEYDDTFRGSVAMGKTDDEFPWILMKMAHDSEYRETLRAWSRRIAKRFDSTESIKYLLLKYLHLVEEG